MRFFRRRVPGHEGHPRAHLLPSRGRWDRTEAGARLSPVSKDKKFKPILLTPDDEETTKHIARFIEVLHIDDSEVTA